MKANLITDKNNLNYLTGKNYSNYFILETLNQSFLFTDPRYQHAKKECKDFEVIIYTNIGESIKEFLSNNPITEIEFNPQNLTVDKLRIFKKLFKGIKFLKCKKSQIQEQRKIKNQIEIQKITESQSLNEKIYKIVLSKLKNGVSEQEIANIIKIEAIKNNADISFEPIVGFAENSANIHHNPTNKKYKDGDCALIDMGVKLNGYCSDMTRVIKSKNKDYLTHYDFLKNLIKKIEENFNKFKTLEDIDKFARSEYEKLKNINLPHSLGHGIGIEVHEKPFFGEKTKIQDGLVFTIEPGIYIPGKYGIRLENIYYIQDSKLHNTNKLKL